MCRGYPESFEKLQVHSVYEIHQWQEVDQVSKTMRRLSQWRAAYCADLSAMHKWSGNHDSCACLQTFCTERFFWGMRILVLPIIFLRLLKKCVCCAIVCAIKNYDVWTEPLAVRNILDVSWRNLFSALVILRTHSRSRLYQYKPTFRLRWLKNRGAVLIIVVWTFLVNKLNVSLYDR